MASRRARSNPGRCDKGTAPGCTQTSRDWRRLPPVRQVHNPPMAWACLDCGRKGEVPTRALAQEAARNHAKAKGHRVRFRRTAG